MEAQRISTESTAIASSRAATRTWSHPAPFRFLRVGGCVLFAGAIVFEHAERLGISVMLKLQETENDQDMDGGDLGTERKLYLREIVARFGHLLAVHFNLGEENSQTPRQVRDMARWVSELDPYGHLVTIHNQSPRSEPRLEALLGPQLGTASQLTGASIQADWDDVHRDVLHWIARSDAAGRPWSVSNDEQGVAGDGIMPDNLWPSANARHSRVAQVLWGTLMAGGTGVEAYFGGSSTGCGDLNCGDMRRRARWWEHCNAVLQFFRAIPFWEMSSADQLVRNGDFCFRRRTQIYAVRTAFPRCHCSGPCSMTLAFSFRRQSFSAVVSQFQFHCMTRLHFIT